MSIENVFPNRKKYDLKTPLRHSFGKANQEALKEFMESSCYKGENNLKKKYEMARAKYNDLMKEFIGGDSYEFPLYHELGSEDPANVLSEIENHIAENALNLRGRFEAMIETAKENQEYKESQKIGNLKNFKI